MTKVADIFSSDMSAYLLGRNRLSTIDGSQEFENLVISSPGAYFDRLSADGYKAFSVQMNHNSLRPLGDLKAIGQMKSLLSHLEPHIIHSHNSKGGAIGRIAAKRARIEKIIHQVHGFNFTKKKGIRRKVFEKIERYLSSITDLLIFQNWSDYTISNSIGFDSLTHLLYIGNGIDFSELESQVEDRQIASPKTLNRLVLGCVGRFEVVKNQRMIFNALEMLEDVPTELHLFGDGPLLGDYQKLVVSKGLQDSVVFHGWVNRSVLIRELRKCNLAVLASLGEGKPRSLMEASYLGIPLVGTDVIGTSEVIRDGVNGFLIPLNDSALMADRMKKLYEDNVLWEDMSRNCKRLANEEFDEAKIIERLMLIYRSLRENSMRELIKTVEGGRAWQNVSL